MLKKNVNSMSKLKFRAWFVLCRKKRTRTYFSVIFSEDTIDDETEESLDDPEENGNRLNHIDIRTGNKIST